MIDMPTEAEPVRLVEGDAYTRLREMPDGCARMCVTSPPYYMLRDYGVQGQIGLEDHPKEYIERLVEVFREVRRILRKDGTLWVNLGDTYNAYNGGRGPGRTTLEGRENCGQPTLPRGYGLTVKDRKNKDLLGIPWQVAFALQADGWFLRQDIVWQKPAPMPENVRDRYTKSHEYLFLLSRADRYHFNRGRDDGSVWSIVAGGTGTGHSAPMPESLAKKCILAGSEIGDVVLDPFGGSGTTGHVAIATDRRAVLIELNPAYIEDARKRIDTAMGRGPGSLFAEAV